MIKRRELGVWSEKDEKKNFGPIRGWEIKKNCLEFGNKNKFHKTLRAEGECAERTQGGWEVGS
jgi:hypothetical protein